MYQKFHIPIYNKTIFPDDNDVQCQRKRSDIK